VFVERPRSSRFARLASIFTRAFPRPKTRSRSSSRGRAINIATACRLDGRVVPPPLIELSARPVEIS
jgi:hypothetical protein